MMIVGTSPTIQTSRGLLAAGCGKLPQAHLRRRDGAQERERLVPRVGKGEECPPPARKSGCQLFAFIDVHDVHLPHVGEERPDDLRRPVPAGLDRPERVKSWKLCLTAMPGDGSIMLPAMAVSLLARRQREV
jgi:hypothetical protein